MLSLQPDCTTADTDGIGLVGPHPLGVVARRHDGESALEVRAFFRARASGIEDPVTGSLNAAVAQWLLGNGTLEAPYLASQGGAIGRTGIVHVSVANGQIWIGGQSHTVITGLVDL